MLKAPAVVLRNLLVLHESLRAESSGGEPSPRTSRHLLDTAYALCVSTGARTVEEAVAEAYRLLDEEPAAA
jgi:anthranilate phosphoribosyltransferase